VENVLKDGNAGRPAPEIYVLQTAMHPIGDELNLAIRTTGDPAAVASTLREAVPALDPGAAIGQMTPLASELSASVAQPRFATAVLGVFAAIALVLASIGMYGVLSYAVAQRRRELGLRRALGASRRDLTVLVLREGLLVASAGLAAGVLAATGLTRLLTALLFGVTPLDVVAYAAAPAILLPVAAAACLFPALRASAVDPSISLRGE
jgi:putative ABC transport system permease protein